MGFLPSASPSSFTPPPPVLSEKARQEAEDDKRRRNTAASARFRHKKRLREQILEKTAQEMTAKSDRLQVRVRELEMEIKWLRGLVVEKDSKGTLKRSLGVTLGIASPTGGAMSAGTGSVGGIGINIPGGGGPNISLPMAHSNLLSSSLPASLAMPPSPFGSPTSFIPGAHYPFGVDNNGSSGSSFTSHSTVSPSALVNQGGGHGVKAESASGTKASSRRSKKAQ
ncbi:hypothetical protein BGZ83_004135 [Gryganskiella cystojenkinii]|nr:hypothetical protein BGZ83_004135 [Gryganskiella cystojenkinii]